MSLKVRPLTPKERHTLRSWERCGQAIRYRRARILWLSAQGQSCPKIARALGIHPETVRRTLKAFAHGGLPALEPKPRSGRPAVATPQVGQALLELLQRSPQEFGLPTARWTLEDLASVAASQGLPVLSREGVRQALRRVGTTYCKAKGWLTSPDPRSAFKKSVVTG